MESDWESLCSFHSSGHHVSLTITELCIGPPCRFLDIAAGYNTPVEQFGMNVFTDIHGGLRLFDNYLARDLVGFPVA